MSKLSNNNSNIYRIGRNEAQVIYFERCQSKLPPMNDSADLNGFKSSCSSIRITKSKNIYAVKNKLSSTLSKKDHANSFYFRYHQDEVEAEMSSARKKETLVSPKLNNRYRYSVIPTVI